MNDSVHFVASEASVDLKPSSEPGFSTFTIAPPGAPVLKLRVDGATKAAILLALVDDCAPARPTRIDTVRDEVPGSEPAP